MQIPKSLQETVARVHGEAGRQWLSTLPALLDKCRERWSLELDQPFDNLSYNLVIPGRDADGAAIVLKVGVPCRELLTEAAALELFGGVGAMRLLAHDAARGILLMERICPGTPIGETQGEAEVTHAAAALMRRLWRTPPSNHPFPSLTVWFRAFEQLRQRFNGGSGPFPPDLIARAEHELALLIASAEPDVILHGDFHHTNLLFSAGDGWVAIDPKGICGDRGYEIGSFMLNRLPARAAESVTMEILSRRLSIFSDDLEIKRERLKGWAFCHAVLSALWDLEEAAEWRGTIHLAQMIEQLR